MRQLREENIRRTFRLRCEKGSVPLTAAGFCVKVVRVLAASYFTECDDESKSS